MKVKIVLNKLKSKNPNNLDHEMLSIWYLVPLTSNSNPTFFIINFSPRGDCGERAIIFN